MDDNCGEWVEAVGVARGVVSRRWVWLVGGCIGVVIGVGVASGWNLWVWLECIGVVSGCWCKEVYRYPHSNYYFSLLHLY